MFSIFGSGNRVDLSLSHVILDLKDENDLKFEDVVGMENEIELVKNRLLRPHFDSKLNVPLVKSVLLYGPRGTGKTKLSRVIASEFSNAHRRSSFFARRVNMFHVNSGKMLGNGIGDTLRKMSSIFTGISNSSPAILIVDDIDALLSPRNEDSVVISAHLNSCIANELRIGSHLLIFVTAICDPSVLPLKFQVTIPCYPLNSNGRKKLLSSHALKWELDFTPDVLNNIVSHTRGCSQAKLISVVDELISRQYFSGMNETPKWSEIIGAVLAVIRPNNLADFSSNCFRVLPAPQLLAPLVENNVQDIVTEIRSRFAGDLLMLEKEGRVRKLLYVYHPSNPAKMRSFYEAMLNDAIVPLVLQHPSFSDIPSFIIKEDIVTQEPAAAFSSLLSNIREANAYQKPCFLLIHNLPNVMSKLCPTRDDLNTLAAALNLCSPQVFVLLTGSVPQNKLQGPLRDAILKDLMIQPVTEEEKLAFMQQAFDVDEIEEGEEGERRVKFARLDDHLLFERAKEVAKSLSLEDLKDFHGKLADAKTLSRINGADMQAKVIEAMEEGGGMLNRSNTEEDANSEVGETTNRRAEADTAITANSRRRLRRAKN